MMKLKSINLIPKSALTQSLLKQAVIGLRKNKDLRNLTVISLVISLSIVLRLGLIAGIKHGLAGSKRIMQQTKLKLGQLQSQALELEKEKTDLLKQEQLQKQRLDFLGSSSSENKKYSKLLADISQLAPQDLWINRCVLSEQEIRITGSTLDNQLVTQFMDKLDQSGFLKNSSFVSSEKQVSDSHTIYNFEFTTQPAWKTAAGEK